MAAGSRYGRGLAHRLHAWEGRLLCRKAGSRWRSDDTWKAFFERSLRKERGRFMGAGFEPAFNRVLRHIWQRAAFAAKPAGDEDHRHPKAVAWTACQHIDAVGAERHVVEQMANDPAGRMLKRCRR